MQAVKVGEAGKNAEPRLVDREKDYGMEPKPESGGPSPSPADEDVGLECPRAKIKNCSNF
jgi:hypothetical protein